jgi:hypothetical protein
MAGFINVHDWIHMWSLINKLSMGGYRWYVFEMRKKMKL